MVGLDRDRAATDRQIPSAAPAVKEPMTHACSLSATFQPLINQIWDGLTPQRRIHILGAVHMATTLAERHGLGIEAAALAGLLHDRSKEMDPDAMRADLERWDDPVPDEDLDFPKLWHGLHAAAWARHEVGIDQPDILEAVRLHTTADAGVGPLTRLLYVADFCEPGRRHHSAAEVLRVARSDLEEGFRQALIAKAGRMFMRGKLMNPRARRAMAAYAPEEAARMDLRGENELERAAIEED